MSSRLVGIDIATNRTREIAAIGVEVGAHGTGPFITTRHTVRLREGRR